jgi:LysR family transcriptional regulator, cys regulon transcriptional activator
MTLTQLKYLVAIADAGLNITLAADRVHATQPGLSKQLKLLEDGLGFLLFARKGRSLESITSAGQNVIAHARRILLEASNIRAYAANARSETEGKLVLVTTPTQSRYVLPHPITKLKQKYPGVSVHLQSSEESEVLRRLSAEQADLAIISTSSAAPSSGFVIPLFRWKRMAIVPKNHALAAHRTRLTMPQLAQYQLISYESSNRTDSSLQRSFRDAGLALTIAMTAPEADLIKTYVRTGLGVGIVAEIALNAHLDQDLHVLELPKEIPHCICWAVLPQDRVARSYVLDLLCDVAPQLDRVDIQRGLSGLQSYQAPEPPDWLSLSQSFSI